MHHHHHQRHRYSPPPEPKKPKDPYQLKIEEMAEVAYPDLRNLRNFMDDGLKWQSRGHPSCTILQVSIDK